MRLLRLPVRGRRAGDDPAAAPAESADDAADGAHDRRRQQGLRHPLQPERYQTAQVQGGASV